MQIIQAPLLVVINASLTSCNLHYRFTPCENEVHEEHKKKMLQPPKVNKGKHVHPASHPTFSSAHWYTKRVYLIKFNERTEH